MFSICILRHLQKVAELDLLVTPFILDYLSTKVSRHPSRFWKWGENLKPFRCLYSLSRNQATRSERSSSVCTWGNNSLKTTPVVLHPCCFCPCSEASGLHLCAGPHQDAFLVHWICCGRPCERALARSCDFCLHCGGCDSRGAMLKVSTSCRFWNKVWSYKSLYVLEKFYFCYSLNC